MNETHLPASFCKSSAVINFLDKHKSRNVLNFCSLESVILNQLLTESTIKPRWTGVCVGSSTDLSKPMQ